MVTKDDGYGLNEKDGDDDDEVIVVNNTTEKPKKSELVKKETLEYTDINQVIHACSKLDIEYKIEIPTSEEYIGMANLATFGDPESPETECIKRDIQLLLRHPANSRHPLANLFRDFNSKVEEIQVLYLKLNGRYKTYLINFRKLVIAALRLYRLKEREYLKEIDELKEKIKKIGETEQKDKPVISNVTKPMLDTFLATIGNQYIEQYFVSKRAGDEKWVTAKDAFVAKCKEYFKLNHTHPEYFGKRLWALQTKERGDDNDTKTSTNKA